MKALERGHNYDGTVFAKGLMFNLLNCIHLLSIWQQIGQLSYENTKLFMVVILICRSIDESMLYYNSANEYIHFHFTSQIIIQKIKY